MAGTTFAVGLQFSAKTQALDAAYKKLNALNAAAAKTGGAANNIRKFGAAGQAAAGGLKSAAISASGLGAALQAALGPLAAVTSAAALLGKALNTTFERGAAEQKLRNFTDSAGEYQAALGLASKATSQFGISQTEATAALADTYGRLKGLGFGLKETGEIYTGFNAIALKSGTTAEDAAGAFLQLSQALGSGKLQGDELRAILERMPQLAQAISKSMGVSAAEIRKMGQEGKITSEVIYKALSEAAESADGLGNTLNAQQQAMKNLGQVADQVFNLIGKALAPAVIKATEGITWVVRELADWYEYIAGAVFPKVQQALQPLTEALKNAFSDVELKSVISLLQNVLIKVFEVLTWHLGNMSKVLAVVVNALKAVASNPVFKFMADQMGRLVNLLGLGGSKVDEFKEKQKGSTEESLKTLNSYSKLPEKVEDAAAKAKELKKAQQGVTKAIQDASKAAEAQAATQGAMLNQQTSILQARLTAETAINDVLLQQAQRQLEGAKTQADRVTAAQKVYDLTVRQAELERAQTQAQIAAATQQAALAAQSAQIKERELAAEVQMAQAKGIATEAHFAALEAQRQALGLAQIHLQTTSQMAAEQLRAADAIYKGKIAAADAQLQTNLMTQNIQQSAQGAAQLAANLGKAASNAAAVQSAMGGNGSQGGRPAPGGILSSFGEAGKNAYFQTELKKAFDDLNKVYGNRPGQFQTKYREIMDRFGSMANSYNQRQGQAAYNSARDSFNQGYRGYADGGFVTSPELAMVGEGGESEYIIPTSKMQSAMANYAAGKRGNSVVSSTPQVNIKTGPVTQMGGNDYVSKADLTNGISQAVSQTISILRRDPSVRRSIGVSQ